ncbi:nuclear transport factor 2 family protein [Daejeonella sp.]|uniref:nuclear transport factor 2 family protein n=1 Tax=Daejeonella sp. TaxID=2805397 RepID=UPI0027B98337|nr:nuclear transport factor 2 family protein [Daejeonella sp.]
MKGFFAVLIILTFSVLSLSAQSKDEKDVAAAVEKLNKAMVDPEKSTLQSIVSEGLSYGHSGGIVQNKEVFIDDLINGAFNFSSISPTNQTISITGTIAIVRNILVAKATDSGVPTDLRIGNAMVWRKESGAWKLLVRQAFMIQ